MSRLWKISLQRFGSGDKQRVLALAAEDIEWIVPKWPTNEHSGVYRHAGTGAGLRDGREPQTLTDLKLAKLGECIFFIELTGRGEKIGM